MTLKTAKGKRVIPIRTISKIVFHESNKTSPAGTLEGVVTYYFNKNYGDKPDVGSEVFALHTSKIGVKNLTC
ncbi:MAG: hypothetical protein HY050_03130 [Actinobacteria bacterium]|nr:hypothetical protein [Actinomycetota bacterium]